LLVFLIEILKSLDKLDAIIVISLDKCPFSDVEVELVESGFSDEPPKSLMWVLLHEFNSFSE